MRAVRIWLVVWLAVMLVLILLPAPVRDRPVTQASPCPEGAAGCDGLPLPPDFGGWARVRLNTLPLHNPYQDAYPYRSRDTGSVLVPLRVVAEAMGGAVEWEGTGQAVTVRWRRRTARLTIGEQRAQVGGRWVELPSAPMLWQDRTMVDGGALVKLIGVKVIPGESPFELHLRRAGVLCPPPFCVK